MIVVAGCVLWLPVILFFPVIKSISDRISGRSSQIAKLSDLEKKVVLLEHELSDLRSKCMALEDTHKFDQQLTSKPPKGN